MNQQGNRKDKLKNIPLIVTILCVCVIAFAIYVFLTKKVQKESNISHPESISSENSELSDTSNKSQPNNSSINSESGNPSNESSSNTSSDSLGVNNTSGILESNNSSNGIEQNKRYLFPHENGRVELFDDHSGVAYLYKKYLDENPIGFINEYGHVKTIGWSIQLTCDEKSLTFHIVDSNQNNAEVNNLYCSVQYDVREKPQNDYFNHPNVKYETSGDLKIEFDFDTVPYDLRDSSRDIIIRGISMGI